MPARHNVVFPIHAPPSSHSASGLTPSSKNPAIRASSDSRPTTSSSANLPSPTADRAASFFPSVRPTVDSGNRRANVSGARGKSLGIPPFRRCRGRRSVERVNTYLIEAYVAGGDIADLQDRARATAAAMRGEGREVRYLRSVLVRADETCFHLFEAASEDVVAELGRRAGLRYERIVEAEEPLSGRAVERQTGALDRLKGGPR